MKKIWFFITTFIFFVFIGLITMSGAKAADFSKWCYPDRDISIIQKDDNGNIWALSSGRIAYFNKGTWYPMLENNDFTVNSVGSNVVFDFDSGKIWLFTISSGTSISFKYYDINNGTITALSGNYPIEPNTSLRVLASKNSDRLFIVSLRGNYIYQLDGINYTVITDNLAVELAATSSLIAGYYLDNADIISSSNIIYFSGEYAPPSGYNRSALLCYNVDTKQAEAVYMESSTYAGALENVHCVGDEVFAISSPSGADRLRKFVGVANRPSLHTGN